MITSPIEYYGKYVFHKMRTARNLKRRYEVYRKALARLGVNIPELAHPNAKSVENAKKEWRRNKAKLERAGIKVGPVDDFAKSDEVLGATSALVASVKLANIFDILREGLAYISPKNSQAGAIMVNNSAQRIQNILDQALEKYDADGTLELLLQWGKLQELPDMVERLVYAVYDNEYARWAHGADAYERMITDLATYLQVEDTMGVLFK